MSTADDGNRSDDTTKRHNDPLSPERTALLDKQEPRRRLAMMDAMRRLHPWLDQDPGWRQRYAATLREVSDRTGSVSG
jgi:hypothetical protein